ncbi:MAG: hypothetical protein E3J83_04315 [Candidatus Atribacteria bacterium]|nr:MAG: hypothetical protein E3J83_04315 [Candidatus Atribacteria bacterium]
MKILTVEKCNECRNRVLIAETNWNKGIATKKSENQCNKIIGGKYGKIIETFPDIPLWCPLKDYKS